MSLGSFLVVGDYLSDRFFLYQLFKAPRPPVVSKVCRWQSLNLFFEFECFDC